MAVRYVYIGPRDNDGNPTRFLQGVVPRDLTDEDLQRMSDEKIATLAPSNLYRMLPKEERQTPEQIAAAAALPVTGNQEPEQLPVTGNQEPEQLPVTGNPSQTTTSVNAPNVWPSPNVPSESGNVVD